MSTRFATAVCDKCNYEIDMNSVNIQEAAVKLDGQDLTLVYFACPKCNKLYRITLKNKRCVELREDLEKIKRRIRKNHGSGDEELAQNLSDMLAKKQKRLRDYIMKLNAKFPGTFIFVVSENNHEETIIKYLP